MSDSLSETKACDLLSRLFRARGYAIARNVLFREYGVEFHVDGWDEKARVGFEFLSSEDDDHIDLSLEEYQTLSDAQRRGELALFIIDEVEPLSAAELAAEANEFLDEAANVVRSRRRSRAAVTGAGGAAKARRGTAGKKAVMKRAVAKKKSPLKKPAVIKGRQSGRAGKSARAKKPALPRKPSAGVAKQGGGRSSAKGRASR